MFAASAPASTSGRKRGSFARSGGRALPRFGAPEDGNINAQPLCQSRRERVEVFELKR
jgi:hypothetical protein